MRNDKQALVGYFAGCVSVSIILVFEDSGNIEMKALIKLHI